MRTPTIQTLAIGFGGIIVAIALVAFFLGEQLLVTALNLSDLTGVEVRGERMYLAGELNTRTPDKIKKAIRSNPQVKTLVLMDMPGSLDDEALFPFATWVRQRGLNTHLESTSVIASGAVDFFLAGRQRTMEKGARLGVHSWGDGNKQASDYPRHHIVHRLNADYIKSMLGSENFYWFTIYAAPSNGIHWMSSAEIEKFGLLTQPIMATRDFPARTQVEN